MRNRYVSGENIRSLDVYSHRGFIMLALCGIMLCVTTLLGQTSEGPYGRIVLLKPHEGKAKEFEAGYKRHLEWHRQNADKWTWYGWSVVFGEQLDSFMDGTFGHSESDFDNPVLPREDAADNAINVTPYADFASHSMYEHLGELSRDRLLPDTSRLLEVVTYDLRPGRGSDFENIIRQQTAKSKDPVFSWYRLVTGGPRPRYLLFRPRGTMAEVARSVPFFQTSEKLGEIVQRCDTKILRFRADMSYIPAANVK